MNRSTIVPIALLVAVIVTAGSAFANARPAGQGRVRITDANGDVFDVALPYTVDTIPASTTSTTGPPPEVVILGFAGDVGGDSDATDAIRAVAVDNLDAFIVTGDISYGHLDEPAWCTWWDTNTNGLPLYLEVGNHEDDNGSDGHIRQFVTHCGTPANVVGDHGVQWLADLGPVTLVGIAADLEVDGISYTYAPGTAERAWLEQTLAATTDWKVVVVHKLCRNIDTGKSCSIGRELSDYLDSAADLIVHGHEHIYQRTHPQPAVWVGTGIFGSRDSDCRGATHAARTSDPDFPEYATSMCEGDIGWGHGYLRVTADAGVLTGEYVNWENPTGYTDSFTLP